MHVKRRCTVIGVVSFLLTTNTGCQLPKTALEWQVVGASMGVALAAAGGTYRDPVVTVSGVGLTAACLTPICRRVRERGRDFRAMGETRPEWYRTTRRVGAAGYLLIGVGAASFLSLDPDDDADGRSTSDGEAVRIIGEGSMIAGILCLQYYYGQMPSLESYSFAVGPGSCGVSYSF